MTSTHRPSKFARTAAILAIVGIVGAVLAYKTSFLDQLPKDPFFITYGLVVTTYILGRFALALIYKPYQNAGMEPSVAIVVPALNEQDAIAATLEALLKLDYPAHKLEIVAVNDGSSDDTLAEMRRVAGQDPRIRVIDFPTNRGKRAAMAAGIRATEAEVIVFVDSDSVVDPDGLREIVQPFADERVGAVAGHADVLNTGGSLLARMQAVRYFVAFEVVKASESIFGAVICCSGCFSAYRRRAVTPVLHAWENQRFLGKQTTYGDDRSLTNYVLRDWRVVYQSSAVSRTIVPETFRQFMRQQMRWKRSWTRESPIVSRFIWRKNPIAALSVYVGVVLTLVAPVAAVRAVAWRPLVQGYGAPIVYLLGLIAMALIYGLYHAARRGPSKGLWMYGTLFVFFYLTFLLWQTYYALLTCRNTGWGTRAAPRTDDPAVPEPQTASEVVTGPLFSVVEFRQEPVELDEDAA